MKNKPGSHKDAYAILMPFLRNLPKVELHRHLVGSLRTPTILEIANIHHISLPASDISNLNKYLQVQPGDTRELGAVLTRMAQVIQHCFPTKEVIRRVTIEMVEDAWKDGIVFLEVRFSPAYMTAFNSLSMEEVIYSVIEGLEVAEAQFPIKTAILIGLSRDMDRGIFNKTVAVVKDMVEQTRITGVDLSGNETTAPAKEFSESFDYFHQYGKLGITIHAGESQGAHSVRDAIELLHANRIGHGVRSIEDLEVVDLIRRNHVTLETCPTSNILTGAVSDLPHHPLKYFLENNIKATINTDDPSWFGSNLVNEFSIALLELGLTFEQLYQSTVNAAEGAFLEEKHKTLLLRLINEEYLKAQSEYAELEPIVLGQNS